jgi:nucleotide sugar dehydrogenase
MKITVVGLGKIGLPLAVQFASKGWKVFGADINYGVVQKINNGIEPFPGEENLAEKLRIVLESGNLVATTDTTGVVSQSDVVVVVVPLLVDHQGTPDFDLIDAATTSIAKGLRRNTLVSYETTLPVGTTRNRFAPALESISKLKAGIDFDLVFSPERVFSGRVFSDLRKYPKLVGGINRVSSARAVEFYRQVLDFELRDDLARQNDVWNLETCEASEMAKLVETTYRDVNIALANQFAKYAEENEIDVVQVIEAANSQPYSHIHAPGIAVGGHCIPVYPQFYLWNDPEASIVRTARNVNSSMPMFAANILEKMHGSLRGQKIVVLGASYRGGVKETAFSGAFPLVSELEQRGAHVQVHDPLFSYEELVNLKFIPYQYGGDVDAAIIQSDHAEYTFLKPSDLPNIKTMLDGRNILNPKFWFGVNFKIIGRV